MDGYIIWDVLCDRAEPGFSFGVVHSLMHYPLFATKTEAEEEAEAKNKKYGTHRYLVKPARLFIDHS